MERWQNRVSVVTGASSGIGASIALHLAKAGLTVVALARREERLKELRGQLPSKLHTKFHTLRCDVTDEDDVRRIFEWVEEHLGGVSVLVNNAGVMRPAELLAANNTADMRATIETNIMGVVLCTREAFKSMQRHGINDGHIVIINSVCGHQTPCLGKDFPSFNIYPATKHALTAMVETYRQDFLRHDTKIRVTSISPGAVDTEIFPEHVENIIKNQMPLLRPEDVSNAVLFALAAPAHVQIHELIIKPVGELV